WNSLLPKRWLWDDARAVELTNLSEELHDALHDHEKDHSHDQFGKTDLSHDHPEVIATADRYRQAQSELESAKFWANSMPSYLRWSGLSLCVAGLAAYIVGSAERT
ncbi:MAG: hypothetical protein AAGD11_19595, partial [Planctomycetota bacterium]